jgi:shikimate kinase
MRPENNIVLIGMPGAGKSTVGVLLAKYLGLAYLDTDLAIQTSQGCTLQEIFDRHGLAEFLRIEEQVVLGLTVCRHVIATGGSVVYSQRAMQHLRCGAVTVHLDADPSLLAARIDDLGSRGIAMPTGQDLAALYAERRPLYHKYADATVDCGSRTPNEVVRRMMAVLSPDHW